MSVIVARLENIVPPYPMAEFSDNEFVELVQKDLSRFGFSPGPIDGAAGPLTMAAYDAAIRKLRGTEPEQPPPVGVTLQSELVRLAEGEVGVIENEGENSGERIREYQRASWLDVGAWPWCAAFICWLIREAARVHKVPFSLPQTAGAYDLTVTVPGREPKRLTQVPCDPKCRRLEWLGFVSNATDTRVVSPVSRS